VSGSATALAPANIAFVKYWGNRDAGLRLPWNGSLSMNLSGASATTTVTFDDAAAEDQVELNGRPADERTRLRVTDHLERIRELAGTRAHARVVSETTFPVSTGIASSAAGFAALSVAGAAAAGLALGEAELSRLARRGSGSAARSIPDGFVEWFAGEDDEGSYAESIAPPEHWDLVDLVAVVDATPKLLGSADGHEAAGASPFFKCRLEEVHERLPAVRTALLERDFAALAPMVEAEALSLHGVAMTGRPSALYFAPGTVEVLHAVRRWRAEGASAAFTLDAGPSVHVLCERHAEVEIGRRLGAMGAVRQVLVNHAAPGARLIETAT
jgi:diphosphomevalonate decarboxylase